MGRIKPGRPSFSPLSRGPFNSHGHAAPTGGPHVPASPYPLCAPTIADGWGHQVGLIPFLGSCRTPRCPAIAMANSATLGLSWYSSSIYVRLQAFFYSPAPSNSMSIGVSPECSERRRKGEGAAIVESCNTLNLGV
jgi:hypothetical protein